MIVFVGKWDPSCNQMDAWAHILTVSRYVLCTWHSVLCLSTCVPMRDFLILLVWIGNLCDYCQLVCLLELTLYLGYSNQSGISIISGYTSCCQPCMHTVSDWCSKGTCDFIAASVKPDGYLPLIGEWLHRSICVHTQPKHSISISAQQDVTPFTPLGKGQYIFMPRKYLGLRPQPTGYNETYIPPVSNSLKAVCGYEP